MAHIIKRTYTVKVGLNHNLVLVDIIVYLEFSSSVLL